MYMGTGIYTLADAARLIRVPSRSIGRWLYGYDYSHQVQDVRHAYHSQPLWNPQYVAHDVGERVLGFRDLLELRVVREFVAHGVPLLVVRRCMETAKNMFGVDYPFTAHRFATDGRTVFADVLRDGTEKEMVDLHKKQLVFREIIKPSLYAGIEYEGRYARRWYPEGGRNRSIVIDPQQQFGKPIVAGDSVPTEALFSNYVAEGGDKAAIDAVAKIFELPVKKVEAAIRFEKNLRQTA